MILDENVKHKVKSTTECQDKSVEKTMLRKCTQDYPSIALKISFHYAKHHHHHHDA